MKTFAIIHYSEDFVNCVGITTDYHKAVGIAYDYACELIEDDGEDGTITPLYELNGQTGLGLTVRSRDRITIIARIYILSHETEEGKDR